MPQRASRSTGIRSFEPPAPVDWKTPPSRSPYVDDLNGQGLPEVRPGFPGSYEGLPLRDGQQPLKTTLEPRVRYSAVGRRLEGLVLGNAQILTRKFPDLVKTYGNATLNERVAQAPQVRPRTARAQAEKTWVVDVLSRPDISAPLTIPEELTGEEVRTYMEYVVAKAALLMDDTALGLGGGRHLDESSKEALKATPLPDVAFADKVNTLGAQSGAAPTLGIER